MSIIKITVNDEIFILELNASQIYNILQYNIKLIIENNIKELNHVNSFMEFENYIKYITGIYKKIPHEVIYEILSYLDKRSRLLVCMSSWKLRKLCFHPYIDRIENDFIEYRNYGPNLYEIDCEDTICIDYFLKEEIYKLKNFNKSLKINIINENKIDINTYIESLENANMFIINRKEFKIELCTYNKIKEWK